MTALGDPFDALAPGEHRLDSGVRYRARTMAEAGLLCPQCTHPLGRHEFVRGCIAEGVCGCLYQPGAAK